MSENSSGSKASGEKHKKTILYCFQREALRKEDLSAIKTSLEENGFSMKLSDSEGDAEPKILIQRDKDSGTSESPIDLLR